MGAGVARGGRGRGGIDAKVLAPSFFHLSH